MTETVSRSGFVAIVGRPNVGKSTLLNALVGDKVSIVTPRPQTTRHRINGIRTEAGVQMVFVDTPGLHLRHSGALNTLMNRTAAAALSDVDLRLFVVESGRWTDEDDAVLDRLRAVPVPVGLVVNKIDRRRERAEVLPEIQRLSQRHAFDFIVPLSALRHENLDALLSEIRPRMPAGPFLYPPDQLTDRGERFLIAETVREKLLFLLQQELPYSLTVTVEALERDRGLVRIEAVVWVARASHKAIVIGRGGALLKEAGSQARRTLEERLRCRVFLRLWVKVREGWSDDERALHSLGFDGS